MQGVQETCLQCAKIDEDGITFGRMDSLAIFILATTRHFQQISSFESRIKPIAGTWGSVFPHMYMVFGTNVFDASFLISSCQLKASYGDAGSGNSSESNNIGSGRHLYASAPQMNSINRTDVYECEQGIKVLYVGNCTGEYFGMGPTCRCQEAMRYFIFSQQQEFTSFSGAYSLSGVKWFAFMDDDVYIRPYSLLALTRRVQSHDAFRQHLACHKTADFSTSVSGSKGVVLVSTNTSRGFGFSKRFGLFNNDLKRPNLNHTCRQHKFPVCMPAIIHYKAMESLASAISSNALTNLQIIWGGTHDALLGLLLWQYDIPIYSMSCCYKETKMTVERLNALSNPLVKRNSNVGIYRDVFIVHRVKNMRSGRRGEHAVPSQYDIARYFGDEYNNSELLVSNKREQEEIGGAGADKLSPMPSSSVGKTVFAPRAKTLKEKYELFHHNDCAPL